VDDHPVSREGIAAVLPNQPDMMLVAETSNGREAVEPFRAPRPAVTLIDLQMLVMGRLGTRLAIHNDFPQARIIVPATYEGDVHAVWAFNAGASVYLLKNRLGKELREAMGSVRPAAKACRRGSPLKSPSISPTIL